MGFASEIADPLAPLRENPVSEEIVRPVSELLIAELLVGTGRARSVPQVAARGGNPRASEPEPVMGSAQPLFERETGALPSRFPAG
jgi:hypothetical protein